MASWVCAASLRWYYPDQVLRVATPGAWLSVHHP